MLKCDSDALECDLAETYHIYEMRELPLYKVALFSCGLGKKSRIMKKMSNTELSLEEILLASICDRLSIIAWMNTKDGTKGKNRPKSVLDELMNNSKDEEVMSFDSGQEFERVRQMLIEKGDNNG